MTDLSVSSGSDEAERRREAVRAHNTAKIQALLAQLEPYVLGLMGGPINPGHVRAYLEALNALGKLHRVFDPAEKAVEGVDESRALVELGARQEAVLAELTRLKELGSR